MTDKEHAAQIVAMLAKLQGAIDEAVEAGLLVEVSSQDFRQFARANPRPLLELRVSRPIVDQRVLER